MATAKAPVSRVCPECRQRLAELEASLERTRVTLARITAKQRLTSPTEAQAVWYRGFLNWGW